MRAFKINKKKKKTINHLNEVLTSAMPVRQLTRKQKTITCGILF